MPDPEIQVSRRAERDLRRIGSRRERDRVIDGFRCLAAGDANLDIKALRGQDPWLRLRLGDWRILYRPIEQGFWVERVINRRDLMRAAETL